MAPIALAMVRVAVREQRVGVTGTHPVRDLPKVDVPLGADRDRLPSRQRALRRGPVVLSGIVAASCGAEDRTERGFAYGPIRIHTALIGDSKEREQVVPIELIRKAQLLAALHVHRAATAIRIRDGALEVRVLIVDDEAPLVGAIARLKSPGHQLQEVERRRD